MEDGTDVFYAGEYITRPQVIKCGNIVIITFSLLQNKTIPADTQLIWFSNIDLADQYFVVSGHQQKIPTDTLAVTSRCLLRDNIIRFPGSGFQTYSNVVYGQVITSLK